MTIRIRVQAKTEDAFRIIRYDVYSNELSCSCCTDDYPFCSHIDAVLIAGERHMVHPEDRETADLLMRDIPPIAIPPDWKGSWRRNKRWRGIPVIERTHQTKYADLLDVGGGPAPVVVFTGQFDVSRNELVAEARLNGWQTAGTTRNDVKFVVASSDLFSSNKVNAARKKGIPVIGLAEWRSIMLNPTR